MGDRGEEFFASPCIRAVAQLQLFEYRGLNKARSASFGSGRAALEYYDSVIDNVESGAMPSITNGEKMYPSSKRPRPGTPGRPARNCARRAAQTRRLSCGLRFCIAGAFAMAAASAHADPIIGIASLPKISAGSEHMLLAKTDGTVWSWGRDQWGQLGLGAQGGTSGTPKQISALSGVVSVVARESFSMALKADGTVWVWGESSNGRMGPYNSRSTVPVQVTGLSSIVGIDAGWGFSAYAIDSAGRVWGWGRNGYGELGSGSATPASTTAPTLIAGLSNVVDLRAADTSAIALRADGQVYQWGGLDAPAPIQAVSGVADAAAIGADAVNNANAYFAVLRSGGVMSWGDTSSAVTRCGQPKQSGVTVFPAASLTGFANITSVSSGINGDDVFLDSAGQAWTCGGGSDGQQGDGTTTGTTTGTKVGPLKVTQSIAFANVSTGGSAAAIAQDGSVWTWGQKGNGVQGDGDASATGVNPAPVKISITAGSPAAVAPVFAGTQSVANADGTTSVDAGVMAAPEHWSATGKVYLAALLPAALGGQLYIKSATGWAPYNPSAEIPATYSGSLKGMFPISIGTTNYSGLAGTQLLVGYGLGSGATADAEMLRSGRYKVVLTLR